jgi:DnaK suppressor protein
VNHLEVARLERYLKFQLVEILQELSGTDEGDSDSTWSAKWGASANVLKESLLRNREEIVSAIDRIQEGTYGNCVGCGKEIDLRRMEAVPWSKFCIVCQGLHEAEVVKQSFIRRGRG